MASQITSAEVPKEFLSVSEDGGPAEEPEPGTVDESAAGKKTRSRGCFFSVDERTWARLADLENVNAACAYIVLARGIDRRTNRENRLSKWSKKALKGYLGIGWENARDAIQVLINQGFVRLSEGSTSARPVYELMLFAEIGRWQSAPVTLNKTQERVLAGIREGMQPRTSKEKDAARTLVLYGMLSRSRGEAGFVYQVPPRISEGLKHRIWLPNSIVDGGKELSPLRRLRQYGDFWALRTFLELYSAHNLPDHGGISRKIIARNYERVKLGEQGPYIVWGFRDYGHTVQMQGPFAAYRQRQALQPEQENLAWHSIEVLEQLGLISFVPYLFENESDQAEPIHSIGIGGPAETSIEQDLGRAADSAARAMCLTDRLIEAGCSIHCPVRSNMPAPTLYGILRLTYRPWSRRTAAWYAALHRDSVEHIKRYRDLEIKAHEIAARNHLADFE